MGFFGGYKLVDFKNKPLKMDDYVTIKGIYKRAQSIFVKRFVACNIIIEGVGDLGETDMMTYKDEDSHIIAQVGNYKLIITQSDVVQVVNQQGVKTVNGKSPDTSGNVTLNATNIKLTTNQQTVQANIIRIDENADQMSLTIDALDQQVGQNTSFITAHAELLANHSESIGSINTALTNHGLELAKLNPFYVQVSISGTSATFVDITYEALCTAITNGQNVVLYDGASGAHKGNLYHLYYNDNNATFQFGSMFYDVVLKNRVLMINSSSITVVTRNFAN